MTYKEFLERKIDIAPLSGIEIDPAEVSPALKDHQRVSVLWALRGGRRGIFARFGLGKTIMQLEWCRLLQKHEGGQTLIVMPLNVLPEFRADAVNLLGMEEPPYCKTMAEVEASTAPIVLTNYERVRDGDIDPHHFTAVSLDEAATLRSFGSMQKDERQKEAAKLLQISLLVPLLRQVAEWAGFEIIGRIPLRDKATGKEYR